jgi:hypothetical protein
MSFGNVKSLAHWTHCCGSAVASKASGARGWCHCSGAIVLLHMGIKKKTKRLGKIVNHVYYQNKECGWVPFLFENGCPEEL